jgi:acetylornithine deacetylase/succinyl-diaminopimelate desuccinylase-like protein
MEPDPMRRLALLACLTVLPALATHAAGPKAAEARAEARDLLSFSVGLETSIGKGQVPVLAKALAERFRKAGFADGDIHVVPYKDTASLVVRYRGDGTGGRAIGFMAHMDVVAANRSDWKRDPFTLTEENGYFFGRGTLDIKSEVALITATMLRLKREGFVPTRDLVVIFSGDEETAQETIEDLAVKHRDLVDVEYALNGDGGGGLLDEKTGKPSHYTVQGAEKYSIGFSLTATNPGGHSSRPRPDNAIYDLATALKAIQGYAFPVRWNDWTLGDLTAASETVGGQTGAYLARFIANHSDQEATDALSRDGSYVGKLRTTCVATMLQGGHAENALPQSATATINCRVFPGTKPDEVQATLQRLAGPSIAITRKYEPIQSDPSPLRKDIIDAIGKAITASTGETVRVIPEQAAYATDGSVMRNHGIPTYGTEAIFTKDSEAFAHGLDERIPVASYYQGLVFWDSVIHTLAGHAH